MGRPRGPQNRLGNKDADQYDRVYEAHNFAAQGRSVAEIAAWLALDAAEVERILDEPLAYLRACGVTPKWPGRGEPLPSPDQIEARCEDLRRERMAAMQGQVYDAAYMHQPAYVPRVVPNPRRARRGY